MTFELPMDPTVYCFCAFAGIMLTTLIMNVLKRRREDCTDFTHAFDRTDPPAQSQRPAPASRVAAMPSGVTLVPDAAVFEVAEIARLLEQADIRFETRQTAVDNAFHWRFDTAGLGTRMCVIVHRDDVSRALPIVESVLNPPTPDETKP